MTTVAAGDPSARPASPAACGLAAAAEGELEACVLVPELVLLELAQLAVPTAHRATVTVTALMRRSYTLVSDLDSA
jgi:hypothetical protein